MKEKTDELITLDDFRCISDDIYARLDDKADKSIIRDCLKNRTVLASTPEVRALIPAPDKKTLTLNPAPVWMSVVLDNYYPRRELEAYVQQNGKLPWDVIDCRYTNSLPYMLQKIYGVDKPMTSMPRLINTQNVVSIYYLYYFQEGITSIPAFDNLWHCKNMDYAFYYCKKLKDIPDLPLSSVGDVTARFAFANCESLEKAPAIPAYITKAYNMFEYCKNLKTVPEYDLSRCTDMCHMFDNCTSLPEEFPWEIDLIAIEDLLNAHHTISSMFYGSSVKKVTFKNVHPALNPNHPKNQLNGLSLENLIGYGPAGPIEITIKNYLDW